MVVMGLGFRARGLVFGTLRDGSVLFVGSIVVCCNII